MTRRRGHTLIRALLAAAVIGGIAAPASQAAVTITPATSGNNYRVIYTYSETPTGPITLTYTYTSGTQADTGDTWVLTLSSDVQSTSSATVTFDPAAPVSTSCTVCVVGMTQTDNLTHFVDGTYSIQMNIPTSFGVASSSSSSQTIDGWTRTPVVTAPTASSNGGTNALSVSYALGETPQAGSVSLVFAGTGACSSSTVSLVMANSATVSTSIDYFMPVISGSVASATGTFTRGCTYDMTLGFQDLRSHPFNSTTVTGIFIPNVPSAPTGVSGTRGDTSVSVSWTAPSANGSAITSSTVTASPGGATCTANAPATSCVVTGLTNGQAYTFTVAATNAVGAGSASSASAAVTPAGVPDAPTNVIAVRGAGLAYVSFVAPVNDNGSGLNGSTVTASPGGATCSAGLNTQCIVTGLTNGQTYTFTVVSANDVGDSAPSAPSASVTPADVPSAPTNVTASQASRSSTVSWTAGSTNGSALTTTTVTASPGGAQCTAAATATSCEVGGLSNDVSYTFTVVAANDVGDGSVSAASAAVRPGSVPDAPGGVTAIAGDGSVTVGWAAPDDNGRPITRYEVTSSTGETCGVAAPKTSCTIAGLTNGLTYTFTVTATNSFGPGPASTPAVASLTALTPTPPTTTPPTTLAPTKPAAFTIAVGKSAKASAIASAAKLKTRGMKLSLKVAASSRGVCQVRGTTVRGLKAGTCTITVTAKPRSGRTRRATVTAAVQ